MLVAKLDGDAARPYLGRVAVGHREAVIARFHPRPRAASVAVPVTADGDAGEVILVSRRSSINGHTGLPMDNAGEVVLLGGAAEPGEPAPLAAVRELGEEAGVPAAADLSDLRYDPYLELGRWCTEGGFRARGFLVRYRPTSGASCGSTSASWQRSAVLRSTPCSPPRCGCSRISSRRARARSAAAVRGLVQSPTLELPDADGGPAWELSGLAGQMIANLRARYRTPDDLRADLARRRRCRARRAVGPEASWDLVVRAQRTRHLMDGPLAIARPPVLHAPTLSALLGQPGAPGGGRGAAARRLRQGALARRDAAGGARGPSGARRPLRVHSCAAVRGRDADHGLDR